VTIFFIFYKFPLPLATPMVARTDPCGTPFLRRNLLRMGVGKGGDNIGICLPPGNWDYESKNCRKPEVSS